LSPFWWLSPANINWVPVWLAHSDNNYNSTLEYKVTSSITNCLGASLVIYVTVFFIKANSSLLLDFIYLPSYKSVLPLLVFLIEVASFISANIFPYYSVPKIVLNNSAWPKGLACGIIALRPSI
jgi:hypothetical protein